VASDERALTEPDRYAHSRRLGARLTELVPGGAHTYAKGADQFPVAYPGVIVRGRGSHVWDADDNEYVEYGMGLRSVGLGHAYEPVVAAVRETLGLGTNFTRPAAIEVEAAEALLAVVPTAEMVKFTKDGSTATTAAVRLARAATGRRMVVACADHPFFSYDDWFIGTTTLDGGILDDELLGTAPFRFNDLDSLSQALARHADDVAAVILEPVRTELPAAGFLDGVRQLCDRHGAVMILDETISGFRFQAGAVHPSFGVTPDLSIYGKALANGFSLSALCGRRELMSLGDHASDAHRVFLLSTTHGAEIPSLAAAIATIGVYRSEPVVEHLHRQGQRLIDGLREVAAAHGLGNAVAPVGLPANLMFQTLDADGQPSQAHRTLLLQELGRRGVLAPSLVPSYSHADADIEHTLAAFDGALGVYAQAMEHGTDGLLVGRPSRTVYDRQWAIESLRT
jgi:glutamate-1-semialdehyde 2,1-aminomutase